MRSVTGTGLVVGALAVTLIALLFPVWSFDTEKAKAATAKGIAFSDDGRGTWDTQFGPLTARDRAFVRAVRLAGLWELPAGQLGGRKGTTQEVKVASEHLIEGHTELDRLALDTAQALQVDVPNEATGQQKGWLAEMSAAEGKAFDLVFANRLRRAHGKVFLLVADVRSNTENSKVRALADRTNTIVLDHITVLENTGMVDFDSLGSSDLPAMPNATATPVAPDGSSLPAGAPAGTPTAQSTRMTP
ncbi:DUF4142 domain-containing protein [Streptomyces capparidis]